MTEPQIRQMVTELNAELGAGRISKIYQPDADTILIRFWNGRDSLRLLIRTGAGESRIHLTEKEFLNPARPPRFCQLLRARLSRILSFEQLNRDRLVQLNCQGAQGDCRLIVELTGRRSNMLLSDGDGRVIDELHRSDRAGQFYQLPALTRAAATAVEEESAPVQGISLSRWLEQQNETEQGGSSDPHSFARTLEACANKALKKLKRRQQNIAQELNRQQNADEEKRNGELLLAHLHQLKRGMDQVELLNYYADPPETVSLVLDPVLTPQQNVEKYFQRYKKARRGIEHSQRRLAETASELEWLEAVAYQLQDKPTPETLEEVADELRQAGLLKEKGQLQSRRTRASSGPAELTRPSGAKIFWGRNNRQNDDVSTRLLKKGDLWFHAHQSPGAHVVLKRAGQAAFLEDDIYYAAALAAAHSKRKNDSKVEVIKAEASAVHKPKGGKPGLVTVDKFVTLLVAPLNELQSLKN